MTPPVLGSEHGCSPCSRTACDTEFGLAVATEAAGGTAPGTRVARQRGSRGREQQWHLWDGLCRSERSWMWMRATGRCPVAVFAEEGFGHSRWEGLQLLNPQRARRGSTCMGMAACAWGQRHVCGDSGTCSRDSGLLHEDGGVCAGGWQANARGRQANAQGWLAPAWGQLVSAWEWLVCVHGAAQACTEMAGACTEQPARARGRLSWAWGQPVGAKGQPVCAQGQPGTWLTCARWRCRGRLPWEQGRRNAPTPTGCVAAPLGRHWVTLVAPAKGLGFSCLLREMAHTLLNGGWDGAGPTRVRESPKSFFTSRLGFHPLPCSPSSSSPFPPNSPTEQPVTGPCPSPCPWQWGALFLSVHTPGHVPAPPWVISRQGEAGVPRAEAGCCQAQIYGPSRATASPSPQPPGQPLAHLHNPKGALQPSCHHPGGRIRPCFTPRRRLFLNCQQNKQIKPGLALAELEGNGLGAIPSPGFTAGGSLR